MKRYLRAEVNIQIHLAATTTLRVIAFKLAKLIEKEGYMATIAPSEGSEYGYWYANRETLKAD
ncbi:4Fe-4S ferredoxin iron-sulfur binding domain protein, partial [Methanohalophilus sp. WG1-DM]